MSEEVMVRQCAPTLAGLKTGSLFTHPYTTQHTLRLEIAEMNRRLRGKGLCLLPLRFMEKRALLYLYRPGRLRCDLQDAQAQALLARMGYAGLSPAQCIAELSRKLQTSGEFPHEIGLFLSYPPEDVRGFMENRAANFKCVGTWKVYGDEQKAQRTFRQFRQCTNIYCTQFQNGRRLEQLAVAK